MDGLILPWWVLAVGLWIVAIVAIAKAGVWLEQRLFGEDGS